MNLSKPARQRLGYNSGDADYMAGRVIEIDQEVLNRLGFDYPLARHAGMYHYVTQNYLTKDYSVTDMLKLAHILETYPYEAIEKAVKICRARQVYTIPYLAGVLETEGAQLVEDMRREQRINQRIRSTNHPVLPPGRFAELTEELYEHEILRDDARAKD